MMMMGKVTILVIAVLVAAVMADETPPFEETVRSEHSGTADDDTAMAYCENGYVIARCECDPHTDCDGSTVQVNKHGEACVAHNKAQGQGVVAVAVCRRFAITVDSEMTDMPKATCPEDYKLLSCAIHSHVRESLEHFFAKSFSKTCTTSRGCTHCAVQARCIKLHQFEDIYNPHEQTAA